MAGEGGGFRGEFELLAGDSAEEADNAASVYGDDRRDGCGEATGILSRFCDVNEVAVGGASGVWMEADGVSDGERLLAV